MAQALNTKSNLPTRIFKTVCPHDCPSACGLEVQLDANGKIAKVYGGRQHSYTDGVICAKVSRYSERIYHPDRVTVPLRRVGEKGAGKFTEISWEEALDEITQRFGDVAEQYGGEAVW